MVHFIHDYHYEVDERNVFYLEYIRNYEINRHNNNQNLGTSTLLH